MDENKHQSDDDLIVAFNRSYELTRLRLLLFGNFAMVIVFIADIAVIWVRRTSTGGLKLDAYGGSPPLIFAVATLAFTAGAMIFFAFGASAMRNLRIQRKPIIVLSREGLRIHTQFYDIDLLPWSNIESIGAYHTQPPRVGIIPKSMPDLEKQLKPGQVKTLRRASKVSLNARQAGRFAAPINIMQTDMQITAYELIEHIRTYQLRYHPTGPVAGDDPDADPAAWPPRPGAVRA